MKTAPNIQYSLHDYEANTKPSLQKAFIMKQPCDGPHGPTMKERASVGFIRLLLMVCGVMMRVEVG